MLHEIGNIRTDAPVGGKARELDRLMRNGFCIPNGFVFDETSWHDEEWKKELPRIIASLRAPRFAVRSSGMMEDGAQESCAGMFRSKTRVAADKLAAAVEEIVAHARTIAPEKPFAVIIQTWVQGDASGVSFSRHPTKFFGEVVVVDAARGSAESVVSGTSSVARAFLWNDARLVPESFPISEDCLCLLEKVTRRIEEVLRQPADIEWTVSDDTLWILQARPITRLSSPSASDEEEARVMKKFAAQKTLSLDRTLFADSISRASEECAMLVRDLFAPSGPFAQSARELGMEYDDDTATDYVHLMFDALYVNELASPIKMPKGFWKKLSVLRHIQHALKIFPTEFYSAANDALRLYAKATLLLKFALTQPSMFPMPYNDIWSRRDVWLARRETRIPMQDFDLQHPNVTRERTTFTKPKNIHDLFAIIREDAKDEIRKMFPQKKVTLKEPATFELPLRLVWEDLSDLERAAERERGVASNAVGVSPGCATGLIALPTSPDDDVATGSIAVIKSLTPEWFTLFEKNIAGIITETGGLMSHGAIQCRERNIPAVFGYHHARKKWKAGEMVKMNGMRGQVHPQ